jgi:hypothetical protein
VFESSIEIKRELIEPVVPGEAEDSVFNTNPLLYISFLKIQSSDPEKPQAEKTKIKKVVIENA